MIEILTRERQNEIYSLIKKKRAVTTIDMVKRFNVSVETVRRDFIAMEKNKLLHRVHGGAVAVGQMQTYNSLSQRVNENDKLKQELSKAAARFVNEGDSIAIDAGSTAMYFANELKRRFNRLTVVTYSIDVFGILSDAENIELILCGGHYKRSENSFCGVLANEMIEKIHVQKSFVCPSTVSLEWGIGEFSHQMYAMQKRLMASGDEVYILADSSKFEKKALLKTDDMKKEFAYVTDSKLEEELKNIYQQNNLRIFMEASDENIK